MDRCPPPAVAAAVLLLLIGASACSSTPDPAPRTPPAEVPPTVAGSPVWEAVLELGPVTDVVVTGGAFDSPGRYRLVAACAAPGRLLIETDDGPFTFLCTADGSSRTELVASGRTGRTLVEVDSGVVSDWSVDVQVPLE